ncbi:hypothetical protein, partial [Kitasatospora aureofaciens]|uniref:hypothetical protein n=1 Tax=Kitasatospora aureofaciens TaxID=1894 RepID=UPI00131CB87E
VMGAETTPEHAHAVPVAVTVAVTVAGPAVLKVSNPMATPSALVITVALAVPLVKVTDAPETGTPLHSTTAVT